VPLVEDPGSSFAVRGSVIDLWPPSTESPVRLELYGDVVLSLRPFDPSLQRSVSTADDVDAAPEQPSSKKLATATKARELKEVGYLPFARPS